MNAVSNPPDTTWAENDVFILLDLIEVHKIHESTSPKKWVAISEGLRAKGVNVTTEQAKKKWNNLRQTYKKRVEARNSTGGGSLTRWSFDDAMDNLLRRSHAIAPQHVIQSSSLPQQTKKRKEPEYRNNSSSPLRRDPDSGETDEALYPPLLSDAEDDVSVIDYGYAGSAALRSPRALESPTPAVVSYACSRQTPSPESTHEGGASSGSQARGRRVHRSPAPAASPGTLRSQQASFLETTSAFLAQILAMQTERHEWQRKERHERKQDKQDKQDED